MEEGGTKTKMDETARVQVETEDKIDKPIEVQPAEVLQIDTLGRPKVERAEEPSFPPIGTKFMVHGIEYEVIYINRGQGRFSAKPCKGAY